MAADSVKKVETASRLARWRVGELASRSLHQSDLFKIGSAWWRLEAETEESVFVKLYMFSSLTTSSRLLASFNLRVLYFAGDPKSLLYPGVEDKDFRAGDSFVWQILMPPSGKIIIDVEFSDLKTAPASDEVPRSIWKPSSTPYFSDNGAVNSSVGRMLNQRILTDVDIHTSDGGSLRAHRAILAARSPVFQTMFSPKLKEKKVATAVSISDMSSESSKAFLNYIYGTVSQEEFHAHRIPLLGAADKYGVADLKEECEKRLMEDIEMENVVERMQMARGYGLDDLKRECLRFLVRFGKICDVKDELPEFFNGADREMVFEVLREVVAAWMSF